MNFIYFDQFVTILGIGAGAALAVAGSIGAANILSAPGAIDGIRNQINGALGQFGVRV